MAMETVACPFCGGVEQVVKQAKAQIPCEGADLNRRIRLRVICLGCGAYGSWVEGPDNGSLYYEAIKLWNRAAESPTAKSDTRNIH